MHDDPGRVHRSAQPRRARPEKLCAEPFLEIPGLGARLYVLARARENGPRSLDCERVVAPPGELVHRGQVAQPHCASAFLARTGTSGPT